MDTVTLSIVGAAYWGTIAWRVARAKKPSRADQLLAILLVLVGLAALSIALQLENDRATVLLLERIEFVLGFSSGPLLLMYVRAVAGRDPDRRDILHFVPAVVTLLAPGRGALFGGPIEVLMVHQISYTALALVSYRSSDVREGRHRGWAGRLLGFMVLVHVGQIVRFLGSEWAMTRPLIPLLLSGAILTIAAAGLSLGSTRRPSRRKPGSQQDLQIVWRLDELVRDESLHRDPGVRLPDLAARLGVTPQGLSAALNRGAEVSFADYITHLRLEEARSMLLDPHFDHLSIEGVASMSGFGSRSSFYEAFRESFGMTPGQLRRQGAERLES